MLAYKYIPYMDPMGYNNHYSYNLPILVPYSLAPLLCHGCASPLTSGACCGAVAAAGSVTRWLRVRQDTMVCYGLIWFNMV